jgi:hypothetical protein
LGIFGTSAAPIYNANLVVQVILAVMLAVGIVRRRTLKQHGAIMATATALNLVATLLVMAPSLIRNFGAIAPQPFTLGVGITIAHSVAGSIAIFFGLLFSLRFLRGVKGSKPLACGTRRLMLVTATLWLFSLGGGFAFYAYYYLR